MKQLFTFVIALLSMFAVMPSAWAANVVFHVTVPTPTNQVWMVGNFNNWNEKAMVQGVKVDDTHYTVTLDDTTFPTGVTLATLEYKYASGNGYWDYQEKKADGKDLDANRKYSDSNGMDVVVKWGVVYDPANVVDITIEVLTPPTTIECYIVGNFNFWVSPGPDAKMTKGVTTVDGITFSKTIHADTTILAYHFCSGPDWTFEQKTPTGDFHYPVVNPIVTEWKLVYDPSKLGDIHITATVPAGTDTVWIQGSFLGWDMTKAVKGIKNADGTFSFTVPMVQAIEYKLYNKPDWAYVEADASGTEVANRKASYPDDANISVTVIQWKIPTAVSLIKEATNLIYTRNSSIVVEGVTSKVNVFDVTGRILQSRKTVGTFISKSLHPGIYIIQVDGATKKVTLK